MTTTPPTTDPVSVLAFIYDRHVTTGEAILDIRLQSCHEHAARRGWDLAGEWLDRGTDALGNDHRPLFDNLCWALEQAAAGGRRVVCLINGRGRLSRDEQAKNTFARRVVLAGGWVETSYGETVGETNTTATGRLTHAPVL